MNAAPVVVGVDGSDSSKDALRWAVEYATAQGAPVEALIAWDVSAGYGMRVLFDEDELEGHAQAALLQTTTDVLGDEPRVSQTVERGHAGDVLVAASQRASLLVVGAHSHRKVAQWLLGSISLQCVQHAHCPVVVVRGDPAASS